MAQALTASLPPGIDLDQSCQIVFEAIDPTTGSPVGSVTIANALLRVDTSIADSELPSGPFMLVPGPGA